MYGVFHLRTSSEALEGMRSCMSDMASLRSSSSPLTRPLIRFIIPRVSGGRSLHGAGYCVHRPSQSHNPVRRAAYQ